MSQVRPTSLNKHYGQSSHFTFTLGSNDWPTVYHSNLINYVPVSFIIYQVFIEMIVGYVPLIALGHRIYTHFIYFLHYFINVILWPSLHIINIHILTSLTNRYKHGWNALTKVTFTLVKTLHLCLFICGVTGLASVTCWAFKLAHSSSNSLRLMSFFLALPFMAPLTPLPVLLPLSYSSIMQRTWKYQGFVRCGT